MGFLLRQMDNLVGKFLRNFTSIPYYYLLAPIISLCYYFLAEFDEFYLQWKSWHCDNDMLLLDCFVPRNDRLQRKAGKDVY